METGGTSAVYQVLQQLGEAGVVSKSFEDSWLEALEGALAVGDRLVIGAEQVDAAFEHIVQLLMDSGALLRSRSHASAAFFAISALEEIAKVHVGMFRRSGEKVQRRKDPLFHHAEKHRLAAVPTIAMGSRLQRVFGEERMHALMDKAATGGLISVREAALYLTNNGGELIIPKVAVDPALSRDLLLFAIEAFDDALVGFTTNSFALAETTDNLFDEVSAMDAGR